MWIIEIHERWNITDKIAEEKLTGFLKRERIPFNTEYGPECIIISMHTDKIDIKSFDGMKDIVNELLNYKHQFVNPTPTTIGDILKKKIK